MATATRMTANSRAALQAADRIEILAFEHRGQVSYGVKVWAGDRVAFVTGGDGFVMQYPTIGAAERAIKRIRPHEVLPVSANLCPVGGVQ